MTYRRRPAPYSAEPSPRVRVLAAAAVQLRSRANLLPKNVAETSSVDVDPARKFSPNSMSWAASSTGGGGVGGAGGGGSGNPAPGGWNSYNR